MLLPNCTKEQNEKAITRIQKRIEEVGGQLKQAPFFLSDNTPIILAELVSLPRSASFGG
ncbi:hypothetical protein FACS189443_6060 [Planctomycetales bacterium]|nr:hypothetical protein FACS189443_6060 [Planctomycetales bacterium]